MFKDTAGKIERCVNDQLWQRNSCQDRPNIPSTRKNVYRKNNINNNNNKTYTHRCKTDTLFVFRSESKTLYSIYKQRQAVYICRRRSDVDECTPSWRNNRNQRFLMVTVIISNNHVDATTWCTRVHTYPRGRGTAFRCNVVVVVTYVYRAGQERVSIQVQYTTRADHVKRCCFNSLGVSNDAQYIITVVGTRVLNPVRSPRNRGVQTLCIQVYTAVAG